MIVKIEAVHLHGCSGRIAVLQQTEFYTGTEYSIRCVRVEELGEAYFH